MNIRQSFAHQSEACAALGSPFMQQLMRVAGARLDRETAVGRFVLDWAGDPSPSADSNPAAVCRGLAQAGAYWTST